MKKAVLILLGCTPFLFGGLLNWSMMTIFFDASLPLLLIGLLVLLIWFVFAFFCGKLAKSPMQATILLNLMAFLMLIMVGIQELIVHAYWINFVGTWTQIFYLPLLNIGFALTSWHHTVFSTYCTAFILMIMVSFWGCKLYQKRAHKIIITDV